MEAMLQPVAEFFGPTWTAVWVLVKIIAIVAPLMIGVAYLTYAERKVIGFMQGRIGPDRVGPYGLLQPMADGLKLLLKEVIVPSSSSKSLFILGPILAIAPSLAASPANRPRNSAVSRPTTFTQSENPMSNPEIGKSINAGGINTNYHDLGEGYPTVLIHGSGPGVSAFMAAVGSS